jgi:hypothetical protein
VHHFRELIEVDFTIAVEVNLFDELIPDVFFNVLVSDQTLADFFLAYCSIPAFVKHFKGRLKSVIGEQALLIDGCDDPLRVLNETVVVQVDCSEDLVDFLFLTFGVQSFD